MRGFTYGGDGTAKRSRPLVGTFALIFFASFLHQGKKEEDKNRKLVFKKETYRQVLCCWRCIKQASALQHTKHHRNKPYERYRKYHA